MFAFALRSWEIKSCSKIFVRYEVLSAIGICKSRGLGGAPAARPRDPPCTSENRVRVSPRPAFSSPISGAPDRRRPRGCAPAKCVPVAAIWEREVEAAGRDSQFIAFNRPYSDAGDMLAFPELVGCHLYRPSARRRGNSQPTPPQRQAGPRHDRERKDASHTRRAAGPGAVLGASPPDIG